MTHTIIDAAVHPNVRRDEDLRDFLDEPWTHRVFAPIDRYYYPVPGGQYAPRSRHRQGLPGSDPELLEHQLLDEAGVDMAILLPLTRGLNLDTDVNSAVCEATNRWLAQTWLGERNKYGRFKGTIRINPGDPDRAVEEIERWAAHPHMVQIGVPMSSPVRYGDRSFIRIWECAARHKLPVAVHLDAGAGAELESSPVGDFRHFAEYSCFSPNNFYFHLANLITNGVFDRLPDLVFVFADGGADQLMPLIWRLDADWRANLDDHPWARKQPSSYLADHVRFVTNPMEGPIAPQSWPRWLELNDAARLLMYGSDYPHWTFTAPGELLPDTVDEGIRQRILGGNAAGLYRLEPSTDTSRGGRDDDRAKA